MLLVDTNVVAYLLIAEDRTPKARSLRLADPDWWSDSFVLVEMSNLLSLYARTRRLSLREVGDALSSAETLLEGKLVSVTHLEALRLSVEKRISGYDARFLAAAILLKTKLVTEDVKLRAAAPALTQSIDEALAALARRGAG